MHLLETAASYAFWVMVWALAGCLLGSPFVANMQTIENKFTALILFALLWPLMFPVMLILAVIMWFGSRNTNG